MALFIYEQAHTNCFVLICQVLNFQTRRISAAILLFVLGEFLRQGKETNGPPFILLGKFLNFGRHRRIFLYDLTFAVVVRVETLIPGP